MYELVLLGLILANIYLVKDNKDLIVKSYMPLAYKICLVFLFLVLNIITKLFSQNQLGILFPVMILIFFYNALIGGLKKDSIVVFDGGTLLARRKISYTDIRKVTYKFKKEYIELSISAYSNYYKQFFSKNDIREVLNLFKKNHINIEKS